MTPIVLLLLLIFVFLFSFSRNANPLAQDIFCDLELFVNYLWIYSGVDFSDFFCIILGFLKYWFIIIIKKKKKGEKELGFLTNI